MYPSGALLVKADQAFERCKIPQAILDSSAPEASVRNSLLHLHLVSPADLECITVYVFPSDVEEMNERLVELQEEDSLDNSADFVQYRRQYTRFGAYSWVPIPPTAQQGKNKKKSSTDSNGAQRSTRSKVQKQSYYEDDSEDEDEKRCEVGPRVEAYLNEKKELHKKIHEVSANWFNPFLIALSTKLTK